MTAPTLYQLTGQWLSLARTLGDMDLDLQTISDTLEASEEQMAIEEKAQGYEMVARTIEANRPAIKAEIERLKALDSALEKRASLVRSRLLDSMQVMEMQRIKCPLFEISIRKNPASLDVYEEALIPSEYWVTPAPVNPEPYINKERIKSDLRLGKEIQGVKLSQKVRLHVA